MPCLLISTMISKIFSTKIGARPIEGSSSSSSFGWRHQRAPDRAHLLLAAGHRPRLLGLALGEAREEREDAVDVLLHPRLVLALEGAHLEVLEHGHPREELAALGRLRDAAADDVVRGGVRDVLAAELIRPRRGWLSPLIERSVVDLPAPFAPSSVTISPSRTSSEMPFSAWIAP